MSSAMEIPALMEPPGPGAGDDPLFARTDSVKKRRGAASGVVVRKSQAPAAPALDPTSSYATAAAATTDETMSPPPNNPLPPSAEPPTDPASDQIPQKARRSAAIVVPKTTRVEPDSTSDLPSPPPPTPKNNDFEQSYHPRMEDDQSTGKPEDTTTPSPKYVDTFVDMPPLPPPSSPTASKNHRTRRGAASGIIAKPSIANRASSTASAAAESIASYKEEPISYASAAKPSIIATRAESTASAAAESVASSYKEEPIHYATSKPSIAQRASSDASAERCTSELSSMGNTTTGRSRSKNQRGSRKPGLRGRSSDKQHCHQKRNRSTTPIRNKTGSLLTTASNHSSTDNNNKRSRSTTPLIERGLSTRNAANKYVEEPSSSMMITTGHPITRQQPLQDLEDEFPPEPPKQRGISSSSISPPPPTTNLDRAATAATEAVDNTTRTRIAAAAITTPPPTTNLDRAATAVTQAVDNTTKTRIATTMMATPSDTPDQHQYFLGGDGITTTQSAEPAMLASAAAGLISRSWEEPALLEPNQPQIPTRRPQQSIMTESGLSPPTTPNLDAKSITSASTCAVDNTGGGSLLPLPLAPPKFETAVTSSVTCAIDNTATAKIAAAAAAANNDLGQQHQQESSAAGPITKIPPRTTSRGMSPIRSTTVKKNRGVSPGPAGSTLEARGRRGLRKKSSEDQDDSQRTGSRSNSPKRNTRTINDIIQEEESKGSCSNSNSNSSGIQSSNNPPLSSTRDSSAAGIISTSTSTRSGTPPRHPGIVSRKTSGAAAADDALALTTIGLNLDRGVSGDYGNIFNGASEAFSDLSLNMNGSSANNHIDASGGGQHVRRRRSSFDAGDDGEERSGNFKAKATPRRNRTFNGSDRRLQDSGGALSATSNHSACSSRPSTATSRPGAFSATGRGLRKNNNNNNDHSSEVSSLYSGRTSVATSQVGAVAAKGRGLRKKSDDSVDDSMAGTAVASSMVSKHREAREKAKAARGNTRSLSPAPGLRHNYAPSKDGMKVATNRTPTHSPPSSPSKEGMTLTFKNTNSDCASPTTLEPQVSAASTAVANQLLEEMVDTGLIPVLPDLDPDQEKKKAGRIQFFAGGNNSPGARNVPNITEMSKTIAEETETDLVLMGSKPRRGNIVQGNIVEHNPVPTGRSNNETAKKSGDVGEQEVVVHGTMTIGGDQQYAEQGHSAGVRYDENGVAINSKNFIPPGYDRPGAYSGAPGNTYDRNTSLQFDLVNSDRNHQTAIGSSKSIGMDGRGDIEEARRDDDDHGLRKGMSRRTLFISIGSLLAIVLVIVVIVILIAGGGENSVEAPSTSQTDPTDAPVSLDFTASVLPTLINTTIGTATMNAIMEDPTSPQALAFSWMSEDPNLSDYPSWRRLQRYALATFYYSMNGPNWRGDEQARDWLDYNADHECSWLPYENACGDDGHVQHIKITRLSQFRGTIPPEIVLLDHLWEFDLSNNILNTEFGILFPQKMPLNLRILRCSQCRLKGPLPIEVGTMMSSLQALVLSDNGINGSIPSELGMLSQMDSLLLNDNKISGQLPTEIGGMERMINLYLDANSLSGVIPKQLTNLPILQDLGLGSNSFSGRIPTEIASNTGLLRIRIQDNSFTGPLPSEIGLLQQLNSLDGSACGISGQIPSQLGQLIAMQRLALARNSCSGTIPTELGTALSLKVLDLELNELTGVIPSELGQLLNLEELYLKDNSFSGPIPSEVEALPAELMV